ncbi:DNA adenine methylase [Psittacicella hinzii]|uniref:D12 class N6 adenine-specific DNA methyltransferase n=1 Tax=Psittacicella hinzii TaxID=2028575 RepID=A0A3A1YJ11_9GAMM|nr:DNA adenine methylase [Psittacicella hinzii]RIY36007.1 hypothetical protein CKF58_06370 [Psittacicella hinzii]
MNQRPPVVNQEKVWHKAPIVFQGQKRFFIKETLDFLRKVISNDGEGYTIIDLFGGSGLLAHNAKRAFPQARVIFNDYDNVTDRIKKLSIAIDNWHAIEAIRSSYEANLPAKLKRDQSVKDKRLIEPVLAYIENTPAAYLSLSHLSSWLCFSAKISVTKEDLIKRIKSGIFWRFPLSPPPLADDYLDGLEITCKDFRELLDEFEQQPNLVLLCDPPYLWTSSDGYKEPNRFGITDFLELMLKVKPPFLMFETAKSQVMAVARCFVQYRLQNWQSWVDCHTFAKSANTSGYDKRTETVIYNISGSNNDR